ncbi:gamma-glutamyl-gamma-aminobutyrate hydrolase family protein [Kitasatospora sp. NBC_01287]|uniref:gamma-glutamyl-gamma-aminobutyrate hydrolase family protein n=1 Tax=Kitasatospora sp. NBC_01287 TaxID=2903573 RepID=UPI002257537E|nr:gamma-glutamyl-gamma-aminobutyrate hydrolase family protein [Kitasatospora sp. NBC_01287]MCX4751703.1 gamma-glutamyl-gamma-aminobutyrate hydrolase family protein [Kitasatospora sp. NBC_01287]
MTGLPLVGITSYLEQASWGVWNQPAALVPQLYVDAVIGAGAVPVLLPPQPAGPVARALLARLDGLVLAGGPDVDPARYRAEPHHRTGAPHPVRDAWEFELVRAALAVDLPLLGVCRGLQVLNAALGGDLVQHLPDRIGDESHQSAPATFHRRPVRVEPESRLAGILGERPEVLCYHHQAVDRIGTGLRPVAFAADGTVEALELPGARFALGVQWHPEADPGDPRLFRSFVDAVEEKTP